MSTKFSLHNLPNDSVIWSLTLSRVQDYYNWYPSITILIAITIYITSLLHKWWTLFWTSIQKNICLYNKDLYKYGKCNKLIWPKSLRHQRRSEMAYMASLTGSFLLLLWCEGCEGIKGSSLGAIHSGIKKIYKKPSSEQKCLSNLSVKMMCLVDNKHLSQQINL